MPPRIQLFTRPDCYLCDEVRGQLEQMRAVGDRFEIEEIDIDADEGLLKRYLERIPVVVLEGELISELGLDQDGLRAKLATVAE